MTRSDVNQVMGIAKPVAIGKLLERHGPSKTWSTSHVDEIHTAFLGRMIAHYQQSPNVQPMPNTEAALSKLRAAGVRIALDTGFSRMILDTILQRLGGTKRARFSTRRWRATKSRAAARTRTSS